MSGKKNASMKASGEASSRFELVTRCELGPLGTMDSYLRVADGSSPDILDSNSGTSRVDSMVAIPVLHWSHLGMDSVDPAIVVAQRVAIAAIEMIDGELPIVMQPPKCLQFSVEDGKLRVWSTSGSVGIFEGSEWPVEDRLAWYLNQSRTLSLVISDDSTAWVATAVQGQGIPLVAQHKGTVFQRNYMQILNTSESWVVGSLWNTSLAADMRDSADDHYDIYLSDDSGVQLPAKLQHIGNCLSCEGPADSREHCTPEWIAQDQGVQPVTAHLFCAQCNGYFGEILERPIATRFREGTLPQVLHCEVFAQWAIKTALTLSSASGVRIDRQWMVELRHGDTPKGFEMFAAGDIAQNNKGYMFGTTMMSASRHRAGNFLATFSMPRLAFVVSRSGSPFGKFGPFPRVHPSPLAAAESRTRVDMSDLHREFFESITGRPAIFTENPGRKPQPRN